MIEVKELRIGNYVKFSETDLLFNVDSISETGLDVSNEDEYTWIEIDQFEPIPLTEEWLINFGFNRVKGSYHNRWELIDTPFEFSNSAIAVNKSFTVVCKYVHQLQNLYFALTGKELTIKND